MNTETKITVLVADDERLAQNLICSLVRKDADLEIIGTCGDGADARRQILSLRPDIVFLDIQMPKLSGVDLVKSFSSLGQAPYIVFVTAFDQYAIEAFEMDALDYLLKPIDPDRFKITVARAKMAIKQKRISTLGEEIARMSVLFEERQAPVQTRHLRVRTGDELVDLKVADISWVEAASQYVHIHTAERSYTLARSLKSFQNELPAESFIRVHRSAVVNRHSVQRILKKPNGVHVLVLKDGARVALSRSRKQLVSELLTDGSVS